LRLVLVAVLTGVLAPACFSQTTESHSPQILLTAQRLRRLKRDRQRQTERWVNFENRVSSTPDSPERGFELALYHAITNDESRGREAIAWAKDHSCDRRQAALVLDWTSDLISDEDRRVLAGQECAPVKEKSARSFRDALFMRIASDQSTKDLISESQNSMASWLGPDALIDAAEFYAMCEFLGVVKSTERIDLREEAHTLFSALPQEFLLRLKPQQQEHPEWRIHAAALALVDLDPNLEGSQYLQAWALEDQQMVREGPGVAYELLWADPYLPGVSYQNMDPWVYQPGRALLARADWSPGSCWIDLSMDGVKQDNCPPDWQKKAVWFGHLNLIPMNAPCITVSARKPNTAVILWKLRPHQALLYENVSEPNLAPSEADELGLWRVPSNVEGKVCLKREGPAKQARR